MKFGRRKLIIISNIMCISFSLLCVIKNFWVIVVGRVGMGTASGLLVAATPKMIEETVPFQIIDKGFGSSTNLFVNIGIMVTAILAVNNPLTSNYDALGESENWRIIYGFPVITCGLSLLMMIFIHREDSLLFMIQQHKMKESKKLIRKIYTFKVKMMKDRYEDEIDKILEDLKK